MREGGCAETTSPACESTRPQEMQPLAVVKICLRRLGLAHTGLEGENEVEVKGSAELKLLLRHVLAHKRVEAVMEELQERWGHTQ